MKLFKILPFISLVLSVQASSQCARSCSINTSSGKVKGKCSNSGASQFLSIPYAKPSRLTQSSVWTGAEPWSVIDGTKLPPYCPQSGETNINEDCLYLNIYGPKRWFSERKNLPIMVYVHGGSFIEGGSADFDGSLLAERENVIVITLNYRLGILGFLRTPVAQTNFGVGDVITALDWIQKNAAAIKGNPYQVTIFGESSGATLIRALLGSRYARGLFERAILQSDPMRYKANSLNASESIYNFVSSQISDLETASISDILNVQIEVYENASEISPEVNPTTPFSPNLGVYIGSDFVDQVIDGIGVQNPVPVIMGFNKDEMGQTIGSLFPEEITYEYYYAALVQELGLELANKVVDLYDYSDYRLRLVAIFTEYIFSCPIQQVAVTYGKAYRYELTEGITYTSDEPLCTNDNTVCHEDDLKVVFGISNPNASQSKLIKTVQDKWGGFAKSQTPWDISKVIQLGSGHSDIAYTSYVNKENCKLFFSLSESS